VVETKISEGLVAKWLAVGIVGIVVVLLIRRVGFLLQSCQRTWTLLAYDCCGGWPAVRSVLASDRLGRISGRRPIPLKLYFLIVVPFSLLLGTCKFKIKL
jgi:hypothetical protein